MSPRCAADARTRGTGGKEGRWPHSRLKPASLFIPGTSSALTEKPQSFSGTQLYPGCTFVVRTWEALTGSGVSHPVSEGKRAAGKNGTRGGQAEPRLRWPVPQGAVRWAETGGKAPANSFPCVYTATSSPCRGHPERQAPHAEVTR